MISHCPVRGDAGVIFEVNAWVEHLKQVPGERKARGKRYRLSMLLAMIVLAKMAGEHKPSGIAQWLRLWRLASPGKCPGSGVQHDDPVGRYGDSVQRRLARR